MIKSILLALVFSLLLAPFVSATDVTRTLSSSSVAPGATLTVTLDVNLDPGIKFYIIDEMFPAGFEVIDPGEGSSEHEGHVKYVIIENAVNKKYTYTLKAPVLAGEYVFDGDFMYDGINKDTPDTIRGQNSVTVAEQTDFIATLMIVVVIVAAFILVLIAVGKVGTEKKGFFSFLKRK